MSRSGYLPIAHYAVIGDCRSAALIALDGSIDWLCWPRFDSPALFGALLDAAHGGRFAITPAGEFESARRYIPATNVLETTFRTASGTCVLRDLMPVLSEEQKHGVLLADHEILREIEGLEGEVELVLHYEPRPRYGQVAPGLQYRGALGIRADFGTAVLTLRTDAVLDHAADRDRCRATFSVPAGQRCYFSLSFAEEGPAVLPLLGEHARSRVARSIDWWRDWAATCTYDGPHKEAVLRSALVLKLLTYAPSGAIIAAPTTSLPERVGGDRNWDYRYCWLRDASLTLRALLALGYQDEADAFLGWMLHATRLTWPQLQILYSVFGESRVPEQELGHWEGYGGSRPVRVGNAAHDQLQLDVYGEVIEALAQAAEPGRQFDRATARMLRGAGDTVAKRWREPDEGIWESRSGRQQYTHSKVLCWAALDRLIQFHEAGRLKLPVERYRAERDAIRAEIERRGFNERIGSYVRTFDGDEVDSGLLVLPFFGYVDGMHPRMRTTIARVRERLGAGSLLYRYAPEQSDDRKPEGAFGISSFWAAECLALAGDGERATEAFEELLDYANDVGLFAEEIDPDSGAALGNFPQAFTHVGLINAALTIYGHRPRAGGEAPR